MQLYPYQEKIVDQVLFHLNKKNKLLVVVPTGGGKTFIFSAIIQKLGKRALIVAHTNEIISQCIKTLKRFGIEDCSVMSIQKAYRNTDQFSKFDMLIVDECHRSGANSYVRVMDAFKGKQIIGVTATPFRSDGKVLSLLFDITVNPLSIVDMIKDGLLCDFQGYRVKTGISLKGTSTKNGDFISSRLSAVVNVKNRNQLIVDNYKSRFRHEKALCFTASISHAKELAREFRLAGVRSEVIHGELNTNIRRDILRKLKDSEIDVVTNCQILTEGFDEPSITCILMARPTCSKTLYMQMIGRGCRLFPGKKTCKVVEFTDNDYDVSCIEDIVTSNVNRSRIKEGETISEYTDRLKKELQASSGETQIEEMELIKSRLKNNGATPWQLGYLNKIGIDTSKPISSLQANKLIVEHANGINQ